MLCTALCVESPSPPEHLDLALQHYHHHHHQRGTIVRIMRFSYNLCNARVLQTEAHGTLERQHIGQDCVAYEDGNVICVGCTADRHSRVGLDTV